MKLPTPIIELKRCPTEMFEYISDYVLSLDWENRDQLTKEEAFYDQSLRYEGVTKFFNEQSYYYSLVPPNMDVSEKLKVYTDYLTTELFPNSQIFRCQVVCLKPENNVYPHIDPRYYHAYGNRIHLPVTINDKSFHVHFDENNNYNMIFSKMTKGMITNFDNITPHSAFNYDVTDRIHIICDIVSNPVINRLNEVLNGNPNATNQKTVDNYYLHVGKIEEFYNCRYQDLKPHYIEKMNEYIANL